MMQIMNTEIEIQKKLSRLWTLIGNTPMLAIRYQFRGTTHRVYLKCEHYNLTGSIKDRMALYTLQRAYAENRIKPGDRIVEASSGNTGISFAAIGRALGHPVTIIMPDWLSKERRDIIKSLGADIILISREEGGFLGSIRRSEDLAAADADIFLPKQFENESNAQAHQRTTAPEIWTQLSGLGFVPDAFVAGVGTGGTVMGVGKYLKMKNRSIKIHPLEPVESPTLSTGHKTGSHRIQGISDEFIPAIIKLDELDEIIQVSDGDSILMAQKLAGELGLAVGISSGANFLGAIRAHQILAGDALITSVLCDSNKKYLSTDLLKTEAIKEDYLTPDIKLLDYIPVTPAFGKCYK